MHPEVVVQAGPGACPACGMALAPRVAAVANGATGISGENREEEIARLRAQLAEVQARQKAIAEALSRLQAEEQPGSDATQADRAPEGVAGSAVRDR